MPIDPISVITAIGAGLKLIDQFRDLALRWKKGKEKVEPAQAAAEQVANTIQINYRTGWPTQKITSAQIDLDQWNQTRYKALWPRVEINWKLFNELYVEEAGAGPEEKARIRVNMERIRQDLCTDFREIVSIYERATGTSLPDHYHLYEVCG